MHKHQNHMCSQCGWEYPSGCYRTLYWGKARCELSDYTWAAYPTVRRCPPPPPRQKPLPAPPPPITPPRAPPPSPPPPPSGQQPVGALVGVQT